MKNILTYEEFIFEKYRTPDLKDELEKEAEDQKDTCPRCGESVADCECDDSDYYSTRNIYKLPKGKQFKK